MNNFLQNLSLAFDIYSFLVFIFYFVLGAITCFAFLCFFFNKEIRLFKNLRRRIYLLKTGVATLQTEKEMLHKNGLFLVNNEVLDLSNDIKAIQALDDFAFFVIGYSENYQQYGEIIKYAKSKNIPIIVLAKSGEIKEHMPIFQQYIYFEMCNTSARLLSTIFNLSLITPHEKK